MASLSASLATTSARPLRQRRAGWRYPWLLVGLLALLGLLLTALCAPLLAPYDPAAQDLNIGMSTPSLAHPLGTDQLGRDLLSRLLWAGRSSLTVVLSILACCLLLGSSIGLVAGYVGGLTDELLMRGVDLFLALPGFLLALALVGALGPGLFTLMLALTITWWPTYARLVRSQTLTLRSADYLLAAQAIGAGHGQIMRRHLTPALIGPVLVQISLDIGHLILTIAALGFLGLGIQPPSPEWGVMLVDARPYMQVAPHLVLAPGLAIFGTVLSANLVADGLEQWLNPWK
ncbi:MAG: ABC transporter permease [Caldilineaceae bacterium]